MQLLDAWKESLKFFNRKNLTLMGLITLKTIKYVYAHIFKYMGIFILIIIAMNMFVEPRMIGHWLKIWHIIVWLARMIFLVFMYLTVRPSIMRKDLLYYKTFLVPGLLVGLNLVLIFILLSFIGYQWWLALNIFVTFAALFYLDSGTQPVCTFYTGYALKMILYNLPVCLAIGCTLAGIWYGYMIFIQLLAKVVPISIGDASFLFMPVEACLLANLYIKWLHEQFDLYYEYNIQKEVNL